MHDTQKHITETPVWEFNPSKMRHYCVQPAILILLIDASYNAGYWEDSDDPFQQREDKMDKLFKEYWRYCQELLCSRNPNELRSEYSRVRRVYAQLLTALQLSLLNETDDGAAERQNKLMDLIEEFKVLCDKNEPDKEETSSGGQETPAN